MHLFSIKAGDSKELCYTLHDHDGRFIKLTPPVLDTVTGDVLEPGHTVTACVRDCAEKRPARIFEVPLDGKAGNQCGEVCFILDTEKLADSWSTPPTAAQIAEIAGEYHVEFKVDFPDGTRCTLPPCDKLAMEVCTPIVLTDAIECPAE